MDIIKLFVLHTGSWKLRLFFSGIMPPFNGGSKAFSLWRLLLTISLNKSTVKDCLRSWRHVTPKIVKVCLQDMTKQVWFYLEQFFCPRLSQEWSCSYHLDIDRFISRTPPCTLDQIMIQSNAMHQMRDLMIYWNWQKRAARIIDR